MTNHIFDPYAAAEKLIRRLTGMPVIISDYDDCMAPTERIALGVGAYGYATELLSDRGQKMHYTKEQFILEMPGLQFRHILERLAAESGFEFDPKDLETYAANEVNAVISAFRGRLTSMPFCTATLELCKVLDIPFGIASSSALKRLAVCLEETGQSNWIPMDNVTSAQEKGVKRGKPYPDVWHLAMKRLGSTPTTSIGIEDSPSGVQSCVSAEMPTIGLLQALPEAQRAARRQKLEEKKATIILNSWAEISAVLLLVHQHFK